MKLKDILPQNKMTKLNSPFVKQQIQKKIKIKVGLVTQNYINWTYKSTTT